MKKYVFLLFLLSCVGCASIAEVDRSYVNHPAMDLRNKKTPEQSNYWTTLGSINQSSSGGVCTVCAH